MHSTAHSTAQHSTAQHSTERAPADTHQRQLRLLLRPQHHLVRARPQPLPRDELHAQPARYGARGEVVNPQRVRIRQLRINVLPHLVQALGLRAERGAQRGPAGGHRGWMRVCPWGGLLKPSAPMWRAAQLLQQGQPRPASGPAAHLAAFFGRIVARQLLLCVDAQRPQLLGAQLAQHLQALQGRGRKAAAGRRPKRGGDSLRCGRRGFRIFRLSGSCSAPALGGPSRQTEQRPTFWRSPSSRARLLRLGGGGGDEEDIFCPLSLLLQSQGGRPPDHTLASLQ